MFHRAHALAAPAALLSLLVAGQAVAFTSRGSVALEDIPLPGNHRPLIVEPAPTTDARVADFSHRAGGRWSVAWNPVTRTPHMMLGSGTDFVPGGIHDEAGARDAARRVLDQNPALIGVTGASLDIVTAEHGAGKWAVHFQQRVNGVPVEGGLACVAFTEAGRLMLISSDVYP